MQLVIEIDDGIAHGIINGQNDESRNIVRSFQATIADAIKDGIPLKLIEQKPCEGEDVISREDLREEIFITAENDYQKGWNDALESVYKNAPSVQPKVKWIPVSESLPRSHGVYQVTIQCEEGRYTSACYFDGSNTWHNDNRINHGRPYVTDKVIAWQEEPEPYKAESEEKE